MQENVKKKLIILFNILMLIPIPNTILEPIQPKLFDGIRLVSTIIMAFYIAIVTLKEKKIDKFDIVLILNAVIILTASALNKTITINNTFSTISVFIVAMYVKKSLKYSDNVIAALYYLYSSIIILNFITFFIRINVNYVNMFFIGGKNSVSITVIPAILIIHTYSILKYDSLTKWNKLLIVVSIISLLISKSTTGIVIAMISIIYYFFYYILHGKVNIGPKVYTGLYTFLFMMVVFMSQFIANTEVNTVVEKILGKNLTFTNRTQLWNETIDKFIDSPFIGLGKNNKVIYLFTNGKLDQSHNMILELLLTGGIISFIAFICAVHCGVKDLEKKDEISGLILFYIFVFFVIGLTESVIFNYQLWVILAISYSYGNFILGGEDDKKSIKKIKEKN